ncbi:MAG: hypothetical protein WKF61_02110 [Luteimonas sp.]
MTTYSDPILTQGCHHIVAVIDDGKDDLEQINGYAMLTSAGAPLRHALTLDAAKIWLQQHIEQESIPPPAVPRPAAPSPAQARRVRR